MKASDKKTLIFFIASILMGAAPACANSQAAQTASPEQIDLNLNDAGVFEVEDAYLESVSDNSQESGRPPALSANAEEDKGLTLGELATNSVSDLRTNPTPN